MPFSGVDTLPEPPQRTDESADFSDRADLFVVALETFSGQINTFIAELETAAALIAAAPAYADPGLVALTGNTPAADRVPYYTGSGSSALATLTSVARIVLAQTTQATMRTTGLGFSANGSSLVSAADYAAMRALLGLVVGTDVQAYDSDLASIAGLATTSFGRGHLTLADAAAALAQLITSSDLDNAGHIKLANGFMLQWGQATAGANGTTSVTYGEAYTTWSKAFGTGGNSDTNATQNNPFIDPGSTTTSGFTIRSAEEGAYSFDWFALGV